MRRLDLSGNALQKIPGDTVAVWKQSLNRLERMDLSDNPLQCDCRLRPFLNWFAEERELFDNRRDTVCESAQPERFEEEAVDDVPADQLLCDDDPHGRPVEVHLFLVLALFGMTIVLLCFCYHSKTALRKHWARLSSQRYHVVGGYSKLSPDEVDVKPEFV